MERDIRIAPHRDGRTLTYDIFVDCMTPQPQPLSNEQLAHIVGTIYREDAEDLKVEVASEERMLVDRRILTPCQELALRG